MSDRVVELTIRMNQDTGAVNVTGPLDSTVVCYGMLHEAANIIAKRMTAKVAAAKAPKIVGVERVLPRELNGG